VAAAASTALHCAVCRAEFAALSPASRRGADEVAELNVVYIGRLYCSAVSERKYTWPVINVRNNAVKVTEKHSQSQASSIR